MGPSSTPLKPKAATAGHAPTAGISKPAARVARPLSALQKRMARRLAGGDFRQLNERLYKTTGAQAAALMRADPALFSVYHAGYADQVRRWPANPLDAVIAHLALQQGESEQGESSAPPLAVADMGCGEARLARELPRLSVHSFDLVAANERVTACDIARTPLADGAVDVVVFCLSLMGTNYGEFVVEARRILRPGGTVLVVEVASRFEEQDPRAFKAAVARLGFEAEDSHPFVRAARQGAGAGSGRPVQNKNKKGKRKRGGKGAFDSAPGSAAVGSGAFFLHFAFTSTKKKNGQGKIGHKMPPLKACVYKKR